MFAPQGSRLGDFEPADAPLKLGELYGNRFEIVLRGALLGPMCPSAQAVWVRNHASLARVNQSCEGRRARTQGGIT